MQDLKLLRDNFKKELELASIGQKSSIPYIKISLPKLDGPIPKKYQVMVIGGTNFSSAIVNRNESKIDLQDIQKEGFDKFDSSENLLAFISNRVDPDIGHVCLNFAFPMDPVLRDGRIDGKLTQIPKDHKFTELVDHNIGEEIEKYILEKMGKSVNFSVANDSVCLLMAGLSVSEKRNIVGGILGTGFNLGVFHDERTVVNTEAACFDKFEKSESLLEIDRSTFNPGQHLFEKEMSGHYLYQHFNYIVKSKNIIYRPISSSHELFSIAQGGAQDESVVEIAKDLFLKAASYFAAVLSAVAEFKNCDIDVVIQGAMFTDPFKEMLMDEAEKLTDRKIMLYKINDSSRIGAALLI